LFAYQRSSWYGCRVFLNFNQSNFIEECVQMLSYPNERFHACKLQDLSVYYTVLGANKLYLRICGDTEQFTTLVDCTVSINKHTIDGPGSYPLFECWAQWPSTILTRYPLIVHEFSALAGSNDIMNQISCTTDESNGVTRFCLESNGQNFCDSTIKITFKTSNAFYSLPGLRPFAHKLLSFNIELKQPASFTKPPTVVYLDHPESIGLRMRVDKSDYHSLALGIPDGYQRKTTFFPGQHVDMQYRFGVTDSRELLASVEVMLSTGLGILSAGFALQLANVYESSAAIFLGLALILPSLDAFRQIRVFLPSSDILHSTAVVKAICHSFGIYAVSVPPAIVTLGCFSKFGNAKTTCGLLWGWLPPWDIRPYVIGWAIGWGVILIGWAGWHLFAVYFGVRQRYACDRCGARIPLRRLKGGLIFISRFCSNPHNSRRTLCRKCRKDISLKKSVLPLRAAQEKVLQEW
jgi:hypothetical protein